MDEESETQTDSGFVMTELYYQGYKQIRVVYQFYELSILFPANTTQTAIYSLLLQGKSYRMTLVPDVNDKSNILHIFSTLNWVDVGLIQAGKISPDPVIVRGKSAVCR